MATIAQFISKLEQSIKVLEENEPLKIAVLSVNALRVERIFQDGKNSAGGNIGSYESTKPIYVSDEQAPKNVNHKGKTGKTIKSGYYESYKDFRKDMGRESGKVNLRLTNDLQSDLSNATLTKSENTIATPSPIKVSNHEYKVTLKRPLNIKKKEGLEDKYGEVFRHTKDEVDKYYEILRKEQGSLMANLMK